MSEKIELTFKLMPDDMAKLREFRKSQQSSQRINVKKLLPLLILPILLFLISSLSPRFTIFQAAYTTIAICFGIFLIGWILSEIAGLVIGLLEKTVIKRKTEKNLEKTSGTTYTFDSTKVQLVYEGEKTEVDWLFFSEVLEYPDGYLFVSKGGQIEFVIPKRILNDVVLQNSFRNLLTGKLGFDAKLNFLH